MFIEILYVGLGSFVGGILRYLSFLFLPFGILGNLFVINILGSFWIGFLSQIFFTSSSRLFFLVGFLGSFTTFSTLSLEVFSLFQQEKFFLAFFYLIISLGLGILGAWGGIALSKLL